MVLDTLKQVKILFKCMLELSTTFLKWDSLIHFNEKEACARRIKGFGSALAVLILLFELEVQPEA